LTDTFSYIYQHDRTSPITGNRFHGDVLWHSTPDRPGEPQRLVRYPERPTPDVENLDAHILTNKLEYDISSGLKVTNQTRYSNVNHFQRNVFPEAPPTSLTAVWTPNRNQVAITNTMMSNVTDVTAKFNTGFLEHTTVSGVELSRETRNFQRNTFSGQAGVDLFNPDPYRFGGTMNPTAITGPDIWCSHRRCGLRGGPNQDQQIFRRIGSVRWEQFKFSPFAPLESGVNPSLVNIGRTDNLFSWRFGGVFHPTSTAAST